MPHIRVARQTDTKALARLTSQLGYPADAQAMGDRLAILLGSDQYQVLVAESDASDLLGWGVIERRLGLESGPFAELTGLVVSDARRRTGVGRALVTAAEQWAESQALAVVCVRSNALRHASHPFYESLGYQRIKTQHVYNKTLKQQ
ncbi:GNAT family N-acetyltransferase [Marinobacter caseinilyticus]|uniref:GNAT family N-acetyltransferase n=1 Tax=Marinobacter caseinilyticus TaxID=2692195 RepID=UPI001A9471BA|nr:GNAT family N-acetyltransferase [Marinobacter caseinilyticus]